MSFFVKQKVLLILTSIFLVLALGFSSGLHLFISSQKAEITSTLITKLKFDRAEYDRIDIGLQSIRVFNFKASGSYNITIPRIEIDLGFDIRKDPIIYPKKIKLFRPKILIQRKHKVALHQRRKSRSPKRSVIKRLNQLETDILAKAAQIIVRDENAYKIKAHLDFKLLRSEGHLWFSLARLNYQGNSILKSVSGRMILDSQGPYYPFLVSNKNLSQQNWQAKGKIKKDLTKAYLYLKNSGIPQELRDLVGGLIPNPETINYAMSLKVDFQEKLLFSYHAASTNISLQHPQLADQVIGPIPSKVRAMGSFDLASGDLEISNGSFKIFHIKDKTQSLQFNFAGRISELLSQRAVLSFSIRNPQQSCSRSLASLPDGLGPRLASLDAAGTWGFSLDVTLPLYEISKTDINSADVWGNCQFRSQDPLFQTEFLKERKFIPQLHNYILSPQQYAFFRSDFSQTYSRFLIHSFVANEDSSFWQHQGVNFRALIEAIKVNLAEGYFRLGASTITMQMVKNLYFHQNKTISRKLQEIIISLYLEQILSKTQIIDIYANIIEFGPDIYGIHEASRIMFGKKEDNLSIIEAAYLGTILPSPRHYFDNYCHGSLNGDTRQNLYRTLERLHSSGHITTIQYQGALRQPLHFYRDQKVMSEHCPMVLSKAEL
ncbi:biosynthetic peptidoglycan transglycosylase [Pseudobacteriovorax antillogorgiicola]|uniref:biosynthetic peptidoglycan transglycosylase n=1 Tax=Pseudobacteriovorax antillogorgiicola TaxID=1513793 RepID=UPI0013565F35|nr:biosynthetic peptidoglycan transglycosylase [Pseudobacteriovorax antillogorgiicola]